METLVLIEMVVTTILGVLWGIVHTLFPFWPTKRYNPLYELLVSAMAGGVLWFMWWGIKPAQRWSLFTMTFIMLATIICACMDWRRDHATICKTE